ncbi:ABC transporter ATP-binding protein [Desulfosarcina ovata]|uniref:Nickel import ATP-binding protein NikE n=1 Tax=Desulfosarcina ovata subsp. ovata TaxID=2752305 RepID=A0A5K8AH37_9BACT|nr:ATP-binding cassette domain-containing protein [Desulfosarcina ovata]BBO91819.1 nickel import ATP-binding protein NikE [Desulfosarcina ovata subsp. ovata]
MYLLELKGIFKSYRRGGLFGTRERISVLKDIHLGLEEGACVGLLGRSGCGKSTLGRIALNLEPPDAGQVFYQGRRLETLNREAYREYRRNAQVVFQNSQGATNPRLTAGEIIAEPILNFENPEKKALRRRVDELLERVGLASADAEKSPRQFSGGELQRICIARAIALSPRLIVLDEAVSSLDMLIQARIIDLLLELQRELKMTYLFISHDIRVLLKVSDRLVVMHDGRLVEQSLDMEAVDGFTHPMFTRLLEAILPPTPARVN